MPLFLLFEALLQRLHQLFPTAKAFDLRLLFLGEIFLRQGAQPILGNRCSERLTGLFQALEDMTKDPVKLIEITLVLHQCRARQIVELRDVTLNHFLIHRFH